ncbi:MAG: hypothetical protein KF691_04110 [Phycisphaeraceae bacterium]|nr:hypothetical protein [Phycisphaeraceae bacterium]
MKIKDKQRAKLVVDAILDYEKKTANDEEPGTFSFAFGVLLPEKGGPKLDPDIEMAVVESLEARVAAMVAPGSEWDASPKSSERVAGDLLNYYRRKGLNNKSKQVLAALARQHVRRAAMGDALSAMIFLNDARKLFLQAGMKEEAEKTQIQSQTLGPAAEKEMKRVTVKLEIKKEDIDQYLASLSADGIEKGVAKWVDDFLPRLSDIERLEREAARTAPLQSILHDSAKILGEGHVNADVGNETGDAEGKAVHAISRFMNPQAPFLSLGLDHLLSSGMNWDALKMLLAQSPLVAEDRHSIIRGLHSHGKRESSKRCKNVDRGRILR